MFNSLIKYKSPVAIILFMILLAGVFVYTHLQTSLFPEITFPKIKVIADNGQQPVGKMMITVTKPMEEAIKKVPGLQTIRSITSRGTCEISAYMDWNVNIDLAKQQLESRLAEIRGNLPSDIQITVEKMNPSILQVMGYSLESDHLTPIEARLLAEYTIKPYLSRAAGVASVEVAGGKAKEYWVIMDVHRMSELSVTPDMVRDALMRANIILSNGYMMDYRRMYLNVTDVAPANLDELENVVISQTNGRTIKVKDIGKVEVKEKREYVKINANEKDVPLIAVFKQPESNLIEVSRQVEQRVQELKKILPKGVTLRPYYIQADFVHDSIRSIIDALWIGLLLAIVVAIIFLRSFKASMVILVTIPLTIALTLVVMYIMNFTFNIMTLGAIAASIGLIIDDAIVVVEQIHRTHEENPGEEPVPLVKKAVRFLLPAMIGSSLSTIVIFVPFIWMTGVAGSYFKVLTGTMIITLVSSFFITWIGLPIVYILFSRKGAHSLPAAHLVKKQKWVEFFIHRPAISLLMLVIIALSIIFIIPRLETGFLPDMDEGSIVLDYLSPPGTSLEETNRILQHVDKIVASTPEVESYSRRTGTQMGFFITEPNNGDYLIQLKKNRHKTTDEVSDDIRKQIEGSEPSLTIDFGQVVGDMLGDLMTSVQPIEIKVFGTDPDKLHSIAEQVASVTESVPGTADVYNGITIAGPTVKVVPNQEKLAMFGITPDNFQFQLQTMLDGVETGAIMEKEQMTPIRILQNERNDRGLEDMKKSLVFIPGGGLQPLSTLTDITAEPGSAEIERENLQSMVAVTARLNARDLGSVIHDIKTRIDKEIALPEGYQVEYGGAYAEQVKSFNELATILIAAILLVFTIILFIFRDFVVSFLIMLIAIGGMAGCLLALFITGTPLNVGSYTGIIMIIGIIGENAIFTYQQFRTTWKTSNVDEAITYAISTRLRPKLMTALGAIIALFPLTLGIGTGAQMHQPLAIAVTGGFILALPLLLIVFPTMLRLSSRILQQPDQTFQTNR